MKGYAKGCRTERHPLGNNGFVAGGSVFPDTSAEAGLISLESSLIGQLVVLVGLLVDADGFHDSLSLNVSDPDFRS